MARIISGRASAAEPLVGDGRWWCRVGVRWGRIGWDWAELVWSRMDWAELVWSGLVWVGLVWAEVGCDELC